MSVQSAIIHIENNTYWKKDRKEKDREIEPQINND